MQSHNFPKIFFSPLHLSFLWELALVGQYGVPHKYWFLLVMFLSVITFVAVIIIYQ